MPKKPTPTPAPTPPPKREKPIEFWGSSLNDLRDFPDAARQDCGFELNKVQNGEQPTSNKPIQKKTNKTSPGDIEIGQMRHQKLQKFIEAQRKAKK